MDDTIVEYPSTFDKPTSQVRMHEENRGFHWINEITFTR
jgi:hypothetical protein